MEERLESASSFVPGMTSVRDPGACSTDGRRRPPLVAAAFSLLPSRPQALNAVPASLAASPSWL